MSKKVGPFIYQWRKMGSIICFLLKKGGKGGLSYTWQCWKRGPFGTHIRTMPYIGNPPPPLRPPPPPTPPPRCGHFVRVIAFLFVVLRKKKYCIFNSVVLSVIQSTFVISRYPYLGISELQNWGMIRTTTFNKCNWTLEIRDILKILWKRGEIGAISPLFHNILLSVVRFSSLGRNQTFTSR